VTVTAGTKTGTAKVTAVAVPTITLTGPTTTPTAGLTSTFTLNVAAGSGSAPIRNVYLDFGDGTNVSLGAASGSVSIPHVYRESGTFTVTAIATDASGQSTSMSIPVVVFPAVPFTLTVTAVPSTAKVNSTVVLFSATPNAGAPLIVNYLWNFGDGESVATVAGSASHIYKIIPGGGTSQSVVVTVTATGADGRVGVGSVVVLITQ
jgi:PKD domain